MPIYHWIAKNSAGEVKRGKDFLKSKAELEMQLTAQDFRLVHSEPFKPSVGFSTSLLYNFFYNLHMLLDSGLLLPQSLELIIPNIKNAEFKLIVQDLSFCITHGVSFPEAIQGYIKVFGTFSYQLLKAGQEAGKFKESVRFLSTYLNFQDVFYKKVKSSLILPVFTFSFFIFIIFIIFLYIIPSFAQLIASHDAQVLDSLLFKISHFLVSLGPIKVVLGSAGIVGLMVMLVKYTAITRYLYKLPLINKIFYNNFYVIFLYTNGMLLSSGVSLKNALEISCQVFNNSFFKGVVERIYNDVQDGISLDRALANSRVFPHEIISMIKVGLDSGKLAESLSFAANVYFEELNKNLASITYLMQPIMILLLGCLVTFLIVSVYMPIVQMPMNVNF